MHGNASGIARERSKLARQDDVEEAKRIVDPVLKTVTPVYEYEPNMGSSEAAQSVSPGGGWQEPTVTGDLL